MSSKLDKLKSIAKQDSIQGHKEGIFSQATGKIFEIQVDSISINPYQPRIFFKDDEIDELAGSIKENGLLQPILLSQDNNDKYILVAGERRLRAFKKLGRKTIPAMVQEKVSHEKLAIFALVENIERSQLSPVEIALMFESLIKEGIFKSQVEIAAKIGLSKARVSKIFSLTYLEKVVLDKIQEIGYKDIEAMYHFKGLQTTEILELLERIKNESLSRESVIEFIKNLKAGKSLVKKNEMKFINQRGKFLVKFSTKNLSRAVKKQLDIKLKEIMEIVELEK